jgi:hypothetical protein
MAIDLFPLFALETVGIFFLFAFISWVIIFVNSNISQLGTYHTRKTRNNSNGESFFSKLIMVFLTYVSLLPFVYFSIYITLKFLPFSNTTLGTQGIVKAAPLFTIVFLILMRILMNPTYINAGRLLTIRRMIPKFEIVNEDTEVFKERILTFFSSYISLTLIVFVFYALVEYYIVVHNPSDLPSALESFLPTNSIPDPDTTSALILTYFSLLILSITGIEILLWFDIPIIQTDWEIKRKQKPLTVETFETFKLSDKDLFLYYFHKEISLIRNMPPKFITFLKTSFESIKKSSHHNKNRNISYYSMEEIAE